MNGFTPYAAKFDELARAAAWLDDQGRPDARGAEAHTNSVTRIFPRLGETGATRRFAPSELYKHFERHRRTKSIYGAKSIAKYVLRAKQGRHDGTFSKRCGLCRPWTIAPVSDGDRAPARYDTWRQATASIGLLSATSDERIL